jgi:regulation of enolase protein 1 (concanavalin A-like superfamily)
MGDSGGRGLPDRIPWESGQWTHQPIATAIEGGDLLITAKEGSDAWRRTSYGYVKESEHALLTRLPWGSAMEVTFTADYRRQFDQAGLFILAGEVHWIKAGVEWVDGELQLGAVVTHEFSDWSTSPLNGPRGSPVTIRASWEGDAITVRARVGSGEMSLIRLAYVDPMADLAAGPYVCAPTRAGLTVRFHGWGFTPADASLH